MPSAIETVLPGCSQISLLVGSADGVQPRHGVRICFRDAYHVYRICADSVAVDCWVRLER